MNNIFLCLVSGLVASWAFPNFNFYLLAWFALIPFFYVIISETTYQKTAQFTFLFGIVYYGLLISSFSALYEFAPKFMINLAMILIALAQTFFTVIAILIYKFIQKNYFSQNTFWQIINEILCLSCLWVLSDWLRSLGTFGNTLGHLAYSQYQFIGFIQLAKYAGSYGLTFVLIFINATLAYLIKDLIILKTKKHFFKWGYYLLGIVIIFSITGSVFRGGLRDKPLANNTELKRVSIFQPAIPQSVKLDYSFYAQLKKLFINNLRAYSQLKKTDLLILPETIIPEFLLNDKEFMFSLRDAIDSTVIFGTPRYKDKSVDDRYYNSVVLMNKYGDITVLHDKKYLVPFGEYIPYRKYLFWFFEATDYFDSEYSPGLDNTSTAGYACAVCFESILPYQLREQVKSGGRLLVVITNDAWYKKSAMLEMHLAYGVLRAVENDRWLVQAANTGISAIIDNKGRIRKQSQLEEKQWIEDRVELLSEKTVYTITGEIAVYVSFIYLILIIYILSINLPKKLFNQIIENEKQNQNNK